jgi:hypothetical protein
MSVQVRQLFYGTCPPRADTRAAPVGRRISTIGHDTSIRLHQEEHWSALESTVHHGWNGSPRVERQATCALGHLEQHSESLKQPCCRATGCEADGDNHHPDQDEQPTPRGDEPSISHAARRALTAQKREAVVSPELRRREDRPPR